MAHARWPRLQWGLLDEDSTVVSLKKLDWISRHQVFASLPPATARAVARRMSPDELLGGTSTGIDTKAAPHEIALPNRKSVQLHMCAFLGVACNDHRF